MKHWPILRDTLSSQSISMRVRGYDRYGLKLSYFLENRVISLKKVIYLYIEILTNVC